MRIAYVTTFYPPYNFGGDGIVVQRFARALARRGHDVTVVHDVDTFGLLGGSPGDEGDPDPTSSQTGGTDSRGDDGVRVVRIGGRPRLVSSLLRHQTGRPVLTARAFRAALNGHPFDVVHFHNISMVGGPGVLAYGGDAVRLYTAHDHWLVCPMHVLWKDGREACDAKACVKCAWSYRRPPQLYRYNGYMEKQLAHVDVFFAQTEFSRSKHASFGFAPQMEVLSPFLPLEPSETPGAAETGLGPRNRPFVLFAGRLERMKGLDDVITALRGHPPADLVIAGDGPHRGELERLAAGSPHVRFLGRVPNARVLGLMRGAAAVIVPTIGYETFGFTILEAFSVGTPVIARRRGPLPELLETSGGGLLFEDGPGAMKAIEVLVKDPTLRQRMGAAGAHAHRTHWSEDVVMSKYLARIKELLETRRARNPAD